MISNNYINFTTKYTFLARMSIYSFRVTNFNIF